MMRTETAKKLLAELDYCGRDNVYSVNRIYGMAFVHWEYGDITIHELNEFEDIRDECNIKIIAHGF